MQIFEMAVKNVLHSKLKLVTISALICFGLTIFTIVLGISNEAINQVSKNIEELEQKNEITIYTRISGSSITQDQVDKIRTIDGVSKVLEQYNVFGLLEKGASDPIYDVTVNGFDFDKSILVGAEDYREQNVSGIVLPDLVVELNGTKVLSDFVGKTTYFTYEYREGDELCSDTIECKVIGTYKTVGSIEENPIYMSQDLFIKILNKKMINDSGITSLTVYTKNASVLNKVAKEVTKLGLLVGYETTKQDYINFISGFQKVGIIGATVILILASIIIIQTANSNVKRREKVIGVLKAYGYSNLKICKMIIAELFIYCLLGLALSTLLGVTLDSIISNVLSGILFHAQYRFGWGEVGMNIILSIILCFITAIKPAIRCVMLEPIEVLKGE